MPTHIADRILDKIDEVGNPCIVGLDPVLDRIPDEFKEEHMISTHIEDFLNDASNVVLDFNREIIDNIADLVGFVKPQAAYYEQLGVDGMNLLLDTIEYAKEKSLIVILDVKRNDIGRTSQAYANGLLGRINIRGEELAGFDADLLTVNPYLGSDGIIPFANVCKEYGKGIFVLVKTSNPSSGELQDRSVVLHENEKSALDEAKLGNTHLYEVVAHQMNQIAQQHIGERGYSLVGAVVGATYPGQSARIKRIMPNSIFLVPGYGAQGATAKDVMNNFNADGYGALINSSSGITFAWQKEGFPNDAGEAARKATEGMIDDICGAMKEVGILQT